MTGTGLPWTLPLTRAHRRAYNLIPVRQPHTESADLEVVHVTPGAVATLRGVLARPVLATGVLFGTRAGGHLTVQAVQVAHPGSTEPFHVDDTYLLGLADAWGQAQPGSDWVGSWVTIPISDGPATPGALDALVRQATAAGLIDYDIPLLVAGWVDGDLTLQAFTLGVGGNQPFPVTIGRPVP
ncbi:hypothetical protein [Deinococcus kurensis]|uniref:hypothetical protein n=1 Tax=Deinococcus kurensis TaxID=2662757 RepID=UPI0012D2A6EE|nr:hypothetical protein [Deinococcus kurensis]